MKNRFFCLLKKEKKLQNNSASSKSEEKFSFSLDSNNLEILPKDDEIIRKILKRLESKETLEKIKGSSLIKNYTGNFYCLDSMNDQFTLNEIRSDQTGFLRSNSNIFKKADEIKSWQDLPHFMSENAAFPSFNQIEYALPQVFEPPINPPNLKIMLEATNTNLANMNINTKRNSFTNLDSVHNFNPLFVNSLKNLEELKQNVPTFGMSLNFMSEPMTNSDALIKPQPININNNLHSSESLKEINIMQKLNEAQNDLKSSYDLNHNTETCLKLKVVAINKINLKTKGGNFFHAIVDLNRNEIALMKQFTPNLSPKSSGSRNSYLSALLSLNQSFGSLKIPSNDSIKSGEANMNLPGIKKFSKEGILNSHFKDFKF